MTSTPLPEQGGFNERLQMPSKDKAELDSELRTEIIQKARLLYGGGWFARSVANTDTFPVQYLDAKGNPVDEVANDIVELFTSYHHQQLEQAGDEQRNKLNPSKSTPLAKLLKESK